MKIITACARIIYCMCKDYQSFLNQSYYNLCWKSVLQHAWRNEMSVGFLVFLLQTYVWTLNSGNFNPSEMSKTFIFVKKVRFSLFCLLWLLKMSYLCLAFLLYIFIFVWKNKVSNI